ncbi:MAG: ATP-binding cassette domain-containing protein [Betaproteobacteria bacterium]|nr:ATP-binding cassette domain-containing protein [Betaproteobacteria bacterium]
MTTAPLISAEALTHRYADRVVLELPRWQVDTGGHTLVLGPSGSGKSTLLSILAGLLSPTSGKVLVDGFDITGASQRERDAWRARKVGFVMQRLHLISALTVEQNLALAQTLAGVERDTARIRDTLAKLGVAGKAGQRPHELSVGEAQRVAIARAVLHRPALLLADEPTSALDDASCDAALALLEAAAAESGATLIVATHDQRIKSRFGEPLLLGGAA